MALKATTLARDTADAAAADRSRDALVLVRDYLDQNGYVAAAAELRREGGKTLGRCARSLPATPSPSPTHHLYI
jgi:hypothetical protein